MQKVKLNMEPASVAGLACYTATAGDAAAHVVHTLENGGVWDVYEVDPNGDLYVSETAIPTIEEAHQVADKIVADYAALAEAFTGLIEDGILTPVATERDSERSDLDYLRRQHPDAPATDLPHLEKYTCNDCGASFFAYETSGLCFNCLC